MVILLSEHIINSHFNIKRYICIFIRRKSVSLPLSIKHIKYYLSTYWKYLKKYHWVRFQMAEFSSAAQSCPTLCDTMDCSMPGFPVHHQILELAQTHVYRVGDAIQPSHPLSSPSPPAFNLSQHQGLFQMSQFFSSGGKRIGVSSSASVLPMNAQDCFPLELTGWISLQSKELSRVFSSTIVQKHQFFDAQLSLWSNSHIHTWLLEKA